MNTMPVRANGYLATQTNYPDGYDAGLQDAVEGKERRQPRVRRRLTAAPWRLGYDDGYFDGLARREESPHETRKLAAFNLVPIEDIEDGRYEMAADPETMRALLVELDKLRHAARMVAEYVAEDAAAIRLTPAVSDVIGYLARVAEGKGSLFLGPTAVRSAVQSDSDPAAKGSIDPDSRSD